MGVISIAMNVGAVGTGNRIGRMRAPTFRGSATADTAVAHGSLFVFEALDASGGCLLLGNHCQLGELGGCHTDSLEALGDDAVGGS